ASLYVYSFCYVSLYRDIRGHLFFQVAIIRILSRACFLAFDFHGTRFFHWSIYSKNDIPVRCKMMINPLICKRILTLQIRGLVLNLPVLFSWLLIEGVFRMDLAFECYHHISRLYAEHHRQVVLKIHSHSLHLVFHVHLSTMLDFSPVPLVVRVIFHHP